MKKLKSFGKFIALTLVLVLSLSLIGCGKSNSKEKTGEKTGEKKVIKIGSSGNDGTASDAAKIAQELKYFEEELEKAGYTAEYIGFVGAGPAMNEALASGELDIALYGDLPAITARSNGNAIKAVASFNSSYQYAILVGNNSDINSVTDLKGKKVAVGFGTVPYQYLTKLLEKEGLSIDDVEIVNTSIDGPTMLATNQVDAVVSADSAIRVYAQNGLGKVLISTTEDTSLAGLLLAVTTEKILKSDRDAVVAVVKALNRAYEYSSANPDDTLSKLATENFPKEIISGTYSDTSFSYFNPEITSTVKSKLETTKKFMLDNNLITKDINIDDLIDTSVYADAIK